MNLIGSDQLAEYVAYTFQSFSNKMLCSALVVLHIIDGIRGTDAFCKYTYMELDRTVQR